MKTIFQIICNHNGGLTIVTESIYNSGCTFEYRNKYVKCSRCGMILIESGTLEEFTGIKEAT